MQINFLKNHNSDPKSKFPCLMVSKTFPDTVYLVRSCHHEEDKGDYCATIVASTGMTNSALIGYQVPDFHIDDYEPFTGEISLKN